jgi:hypothetical protein
VFPVYIYPRSQDAQKERSISCRFDNAISACILVKFTTVTLSRIIDFARYRRCICCLFSLNLRDFPMARTIKSAKDYQWVPTGTNGYEVPMDSNGSHYTDSLELYSISTGFPLKNESVAAMATSILIFASTAVTLGCSWLRTQSTKFCNSRR